MSEPVPIQWFPGHMAKTRRLIAESLPLIDCVAEIADARIPQSSRNPEIDALCSGKPRVLMLNKADLADPAATDAWVAWYAARGVPALPVDCKTGKGSARFLPAVKRLLHEKIERNIQKGMAGAKLRIMVAGVPNCGKSTFINRMAGGSRLKAEDRPGVTRGRTWLDLGGGVEMMDTPGMLWPKFEDPAVGEKLAFCGAVKDEVVDGELLARRLLEMLARQCPRLLAARYRLEEPLSGDGEALLRRVAARRGMLLPGGVADEERAAILVLDEFRGGKIGRVTLELPAMEGETRGDAPAAKHAKAENSETELSETETEEKERKV